MSFRQNPNSIARVHEKPDCLFSFMFLVIKATVSSSAENEGPTTTTNPRHLPNLLTSFKVLVHEIFKGAPSTILSAVDGDVVEIFTPTQQSLCGVELSEEHTYLISGKVQGGQLHTSMCRWLVKWDTLSEGMINR